MVLHIYGIKNCDTMKKAFAALDAKKKAYVFHDYKKEGVDEKLLARAIAAHGWENVLNKKGTTWRSLTDTQKESMNDKNALKAAIANPSMIRRPMVVSGDTITFGL